MKVAFNVYQACNMTCSGFVADEESAEYAAGSFMLNDSKVLYREAKITPAKAGLFVTLWKRIPGGPIAPFDITDSFDFVVISVQNRDQSGQFIFHKDLLALKGIVSSHQKEGKRGFRLYPPWGETLNKQAQQTQRWQEMYYVDINQQDQADVQRLHALFGHEII
jgi:hypothetical protein